MRNPIKRTYMRIVDGILYSSWTTSFLIKKIIVILFDEFETNQNQFYLHVHDMDKLLSSLNPPLSHLGISMR